MSVNELDSKYWHLVSGGNANSNYESFNSSNSGSESKGSAKNYGDAHSGLVPDTYENCIGWNMLGGAIAGSQGLVAGVISGAIGGAVTGIATCDRSGNGNGGGQANNSSCSSDACSW